MALVEAELQNPAKAGGLIGVFHHGRWPPSVWSWSCSNLVAGEEWGKQIREKIW
jgi:hypothetical protein